MEPGSSRNMICLDDFEKYASETLPKNALEYYRGAACQEETLQENINAFKRYRLLPRVLRDVSKRNMETSILGYKLSMPIAIAPAAMQKMAHHEGEIAAAKAARAFNTVYGHSTYATTSIEELSDQAPDTLKFFQVYIPQEKDRMITKDLIQRAEECGYKAIVLTVDAPVLGVQYRNRRIAFRLPDHLTVSNLHKALSDKSVTSNHHIKDLNDNRNFMQDASLTWEDITWLKQYTSLPVILKGILTAADAAIAADLGVAGVWVSNHGGRQLDSVPATIDVLRSVVRAVAGRCEVYLDGGIRCGTDVIKALALGAKAVFIARPVIYGLAYDGENGVKEVLRILKEELDVAMALSGCVRLSDIKPELVVHERDLLSKL